jgi:hypothetical protein
VAVEHNSRELTMASTVGHCSDLAGAFDALEVAAWPSSFHTVVVRLVDIDLDGTLPEAGRFPSSPCHRDPACWTLLDPLRRTVLRKQVDQVQVAQLHLEKPNSGLKTVFDSGLTRCFRRPEPGHQACHSSERETCATGTLHLIVEGCDPASDWTQLLAADLVNGVSQ